MERAFDRRTRALLLVLCGANFLDSLDVSMVSIALPHIGSDLDLDARLLPWVLGAYALGFGGFLLLGGRTADLLGRRRAFLAALAVFVVASALAAVATSGPLLVGSRFVTGVTAAFTAPAGLSLITTTISEGRARSTALAVYTGTAASGFSLGLVVGGLLTSLDWRFTFGVPAVAALVILLAAGRLLPRDRRSGHQGRADLLGGVLLTAGISALVLALTVPPSAVTIALLVAAVVLLVGFVVRERAVAEPLVRLGILRSVRLVRANVAVAAIGTFVGFQVVATPFLQQTLGWAALPTALAFLPGGLLIAVGAPLVGGLIGRIGPANAVVLGLLAFVAAYLLSLRIGAGFSYAADMLPTMLLLGVGFTLALPGATISATSGVDEHEQGLASGLVTTSFQLGGALTIAVVTAVAGGRTHAGLVAIVVIAVAGLVVAAAGVWRPSAA